MPDRLSIAQCATLACLLEATAPKVGNVHRGADFGDLTFTDFAVSAALIGPAMQLAATEGIGRAVHDAVAARPNIGRYLESARRIPFNEMGIFRHYPELDG